MTSWSVSASVLSQHTAVVPEERLWKLLTAGWLDTSWPCTQQIIALKAFLWFVEVRDVQHCVWCNKFLSSLKGKMLMKVKSHKVRWAIVFVHAVIDILQFLLSSPSPPLFPVLLSFFFFHDIVTNPKSCQLYLWDTRLYAIRYCWVILFKKQLRNNNNSATFDISVVSSINFKA